MRIAILGSGGVGRAIGGKLASLGHEVRLGSRDPEGESAGEWLAAAGAGATAGSATEAASFAEVVFNCTSGMASLDALAAAGADALAGKILIDLANPIIHGPDGVRMGIGGAGEDSLAEQIQAAFPETAVVKALNTVNRNVMVDPALVAGDHVLFICGNDPDAKQVVRGLLGEIGWPAARVIDLGDLSGARALESYLILWVRMWQALGTTTFNIVPVVGD